MSKWDQFVKGFDQLGKGCGGCGCLMIIAGLAIPVVVVIVFVVCAGITH